jgi:hypothetical protein
MVLSPLATKVGIGIAGLAAGGLVATAFGAQAATSSNSSSGASSSSSSSSATDPHPGDNGADGVPESQEHHGFGGPGGGLGLSGTVTAVGSSSVTIKTSSGTTTYSVTTSSDIDKNGEASLKDLAVGDAVRFSVEQSNSKQIDKLHAGDESKDMPQPPAAGSASGKTGG